MLAHILSRNARAVDDQAKESKYCEVLVKQVRDAEHQRFCNWNKVYWLQGNERQLPIMKLKGNFSQRFEEAREVATKKAIQYGVELDVTKILEKEVAITQKFRDVVELIIIWKAASARNNELDYIDKHLSILMVNFKEGDKLLYEDVNQTLQKCHRILHGADCGCELSLNVGKHEKYLVIPN